MNSVVLGSIVRSSEVFPTPAGPTISALTPRGTESRWSAVMILRSMIAFRSRRLHWQRRPGRILGVEEAVARHALATGRIAPARLDPVDKIPDRPAIFAFSQPYRMGDPSCSIESAPGRDAQLGELAGFSRVQKAARSHVRRQVVERDWRRALRRDVTFGPSGATPSPV